MNEVAITTSKAQLMTVREVAEALNVDKRTVQRHADSLGLTSNGKTTYLDERAVTIIKRAIEKSGRNDLDNVVEVSKATTSLEIEEMTLKVLAYHKAEVDRLRAELALAAPKIESHDALMRSERTMSITDAAKHFKLHPRGVVFPFLRERGYLTMRDLPTEIAIDQEILSIRQVKIATGEVRAQAVVEAKQLERWRTYLVPKIYDFMEEEV